MYLHDLQGVFSYIAKVTKPIKLIIIIIIIIIIITHVIILSILIL